MKQLLLLSFYPIILLVSTPYAKSADSQNKNAPSSSQKMLHGEVDIVASSCAAAGITLSSLDLPSTIQNVRLGSPALYAGIAQRDKVLSMQIVDNKLCILLERNGQQFYAQLKTSLQSNTPLVAETNSTTYNASISAQSLKEQTAALRNLFLTHDLALIIDCSGSMFTHDCPDYPNYISRWQWCSKQSTDLAQIAASAASSITLTLFNNTYNVWKNVRPQNIPNIFAQYNPAGATSLALPLQEQLNNYLLSARNRNKPLKPLIILIISDGMPQDYAAVATVLQQASKQIRYVGEITIIFLLIGTDTNEDELRAKFGELKGGSIKNGGMFDVIPFIRVSSKGIKQALLEEFATVQSDTNYSKPSEASQFTTGKIISP